MKQQIEAFEAEKESLQSDKLFKQERMKAAEEQLTSLDESKNNALKYGF
jgi:hypothetical protein